MADETADTNPELTSEPSGISRRELGKRGGMLGAAVGAAWTAPMVFDSFSNPAAAAGTSLVNTTTPGVVTPPVTIPANRTAQFTIIGGGGAGGWYQAFNGGSATKLVGRITPSSSSRTVAVTVGQGGQAAPTIRATATGGIGYTEGGDSGGGTGNSGGSGGGSSAIIFGSTVVVVAPGGSGSGGGPSSQNYQGGTAGPPCDGPVNSRLGPSSGGTDGSVTNQTGNYRGIGGFPATATGHGAGTTAGNGRVDGGAGTAAGGGTGGTGPSDNNGSGGGGSGGDFSGGGGSSGSGDGGGGGGGGGASGSAAAVGAVGPTGSGFATASAADSTGAGTMTAPPNVPGAGGKGGYSESGGSTGQGLSGRNGQVILSLL